MAAIEAPAQYERDFRSANKEWKRTKDSSSKWAHGSRASPGVYMNMITGEGLTGNEGQHAKSRPVKEIKSPWKREHNIVKARNTYLMPYGRVRSKLHAQNEIRDDASRSLGELPPLSPVGRKLSLSDNIMYSFDRHDSPDRPLTLDIFVKSTGRDTEKLVEKEYEVVDFNGDALTGRKARRNLRKTTTEGAALPVPEYVEEDEGFELV
ncbi:hypothetical protein B0T22DRAFT_147520 [Podospora appendiculata]|uniref:Uncharacterized protein n=1 Tax=Podospora appendiculata TaxID=314037 RepID=A0AAE0X8X1_9PEZI|nr:hypothetical protein B0T22DRAFT_147520 [Podospora appendiculata]